MRQREIRFVGHLAAVGIGPPEPCAVGVEGDVRLDRVREVVEFLILVRALDKVLLPLCVIAGHILATNDRQLVDVGIIVENDVAGRLGDDLNHVSLPLE